jgi:hypothetical protein
MSVAVENIAESALPIGGTMSPRESQPPPQASINAGPPPTAPRRIPGVFATQHGAIGALAAAVTGRKVSPAPSPVESAPVHVDDVEGQQVSESAEEHQDLPSEIQENSQPEVAQPQIERVSPHLPQCLQSYTQLNYMSKSSPKVVHKQPPPIVSQTPLVSILSCVSY